MSCTIPYSPEWHWYKIYVIHQKVSYHHISVIAT